MNDRTAERVSRLADALTEVSTPLVRLFEYADSLEKLVTGREWVQAECVAALIRAEARSAKDRLALSLDAVQEAAAGVVGP